MMNRKLASCLLVLMVASAALWLSTRPEGSRPLDSGGKDAAATSAIPQPLAAVNDTASTQPDPAATPETSAGDNPAPQDQASQAAPAAGPPSAKDRFAGAATLAERETGPAKSPGRFTRQRLVNADFKYPLLCLEEEYELVNGERRMVNQVASVADQVVVKPLPGVTEEVLIDSLKHLGATLRKRMPASGLWLVSFPDADLDTVPLAMTEIARIGSLARYAEPDYIAHLNAAPNDPDFGQLWGMNNTGQSGGTVDADIDAPEAWDLNTGSSSVVVGVIDSGVDYTHPDLAANIWTNPGEIPGNGIDDDGNGYIDDVRGWNFVNDTTNPMDDNGHGTHCSGTIGGAGNNGAGVAGVCWNVSIMPLKFLDADGFGAISDATEAVSYATAKGVTLTSNSWGGGGYSQAMKDAIDAANTAGILFVAAAGNGDAYGKSVNNDSVANYPSNYSSPNIIAVAATTRQDQLASYSNYGLSKVHLGAPGSEIYSTTPGNTYSTLNGTSMAAPHVAGACALVKASRPGLTHTEIRNIILGSTDPIPALAGKTVTGGRLNVYKALLTANEITIQPQTNLSSSGLVGGPFAPVSGSYTLTNHAVTPVNWSVTGSPGWLTLSQASGSLAGVASVAVTVTVNSTANALAAGCYASALTFHNVTSGVDQTRSFTLLVGQTDYFTELFDTTTNDTANQAFTFTPDGSNSQYAIGRQTAASFPSDPAGGTILSLSDDNFATVTLTGGAHVQLYGVNYGNFHVGSNGYVTFGSGDSSGSVSLAEHFAKPRIAALFDDLNPGAGGTVSWKQSSDRAVVTYLNVPEYGTTNTNSFQIEMFFDGRIRITVLNLGVTGGLIGLSQGLGVPANFLERDFSTYPPSVAMPVSISTNATLPGGMVGSSYIQTLSATDGTPPFVWTLDAGSTLPGGLNMNSAGLLSGAPTTAGSFSFTIRVTDSAPTTATKTLTLTVVPALVIATSATLPPGIIGSTYNQTLTATGGTPSYTWSVASGSSLPPGLAFSPAGVLSGFPAAYGDFTFTLQVTDSAAVVTTKDMNLRVVQTLTISTPAALPGGKVGNAYNQTLMATGGAAPYIWTLTSASTIPAGLNLSTAGVLYGAPLENGSSSFAVTVTDSLSFSLAKSFNIVIRVVNTTPIAVTDTVATSGSSAMTLPVLANDTDADGDALSVTSVTVPVHGTATFTPTNVTYTPTAGYTGTDTFQYTISDGYGGLASGTVNLTMLGSQTFNSSGAITLPTKGTAIPYPSNIIISGTAIMTSMKVTFTGYTGPYPMALSASLQGPNGRSVCLMSLAGGASGLTNATFSFDDLAPSTMPSGSGIVSGSTYQPTNYGYSFTPPGTVGALGTSLSIFNAASADGTWKLFINNGYVIAGSGIIQGWSLKFVTSPFGLPGVDIGYATNIGASSATVSSTVNPQGTATSVWFEYGTSTAYGNATPPQAAGAGSATVPASGTLPNLLSATVYHYRAVAMSTAGMSFSADQTFTTGRTFYVNDNVRASDNWCTAVGNDANDGLSPATPKATVQAILAVYDLEAGDTVRIDTGTYTLSYDITVTAADGGTSSSQVFFEGSPYGVTINRNRNPNDLNSTYAWYVNAPYVTIRTAASNKYPLLAQSFMKITGATHGVYFADTAINSNLSRVLLDSNSKYGAYVYNANVVIENCFVKGGTFGITISSLDNTTNVCTIRNCTVVGFNSYGIYSQYPSMLNLSNSIILADGVQSIGGSGKLAVYLQYGGTPAFCDYNDLLAINGAAVGILTGLNNISVDPRFVGYPNDCHLKSTAGSYHGGLFTADDVNSYCIDYGNPTSPIGAESASNGGRINLGAYGGTEQASRTPPGRQLLIVSPNGGENLKGSQTISWLKIGTEWQQGNTVRLEYTLDGGSNWLAIAGASSLDFSARSFNWDTTSITSGRCLVRVTANDASTVTDISDCTVLIHNFPVVYYINDISLNADNWCSAVGNDANDGLSAATPKATVQAILSAYDLEPGDIVRIDTGNYTLTSDITIESTDGGSSAAPVTFQGSPYGVIINRSSNSYTTAWFVKAPYVNIRTATSTKYPTLAQSYMKITGASKGVYYYANTAPYGILSRVHLDNNTVGVTVESLGVIIENCLINGGGTGISSSYTIRNCTVIGFSRRGISTSVASYLNLSHNIIVADGVGCYGVYIDSGTAPEASDYNDLLAINGASVGYNGTARSTLSSWKNATGKDRNSLSVDPSFVSTSTNDYHLKSIVGSYHGGAFTPDATHSPCIDAGHPGSPLGAEGKPNGGRINMGAYGGTEQASLSTADRRLLVVSPNGVEEITGALFIRWNATGGGWHAGDTVNIEYSNDDGSTWHSITGASAISYSTGCFSWDTTTVTSGTYRVRVTSNADPSVIDASDGAALVHVGHAFYVNDNALANDNWCSAVGNDANDGLSAATPKATVQAILSAYDLETGDIVRIDTGNYTLTSDITIDSLDGGSSAAPVTFEGSPYGVTINRNNTSSTSAWYVNAPYVTIRTATSNKYSALTQSGMKITGGDSGIHLSSAATNATLSRLELAANTRYGAYVVGTAATIENCLVNGGNNGIYYDSNSNNNDNPVTIRNCTVVGFSSYGIYSYYLSSLNLNNNIVVADGPARCGVCFWYTASNSIQPVASDYNNFVALNGASVGFSNVTSRTTLSAWQNATGTDSHSLSIDPQFKNAQSGDYHLSSDSPCRDVGDCLATSADSLDIDGQPRIVGAAVDMGADEFAAAAPEIEVEQPAGTGLVDGTSTIDFGNVAVGSNTSLVFTITNRGAIDLSGLDIMIDGADAAMFTVTANPVAPVSGAGGSTTFIVRFVPTSAGMKTAAIHIASNDPDENPFDIALTGNIGAALQAWRQTYFGSIDNIGDGADLNDFDKDGLANILEFAFGLNPKTNSAGMLPRSQRSGDNFVVSFTQPVGVSGITYGAEWSQMLLPGSWTAVADTGNTGASPPQHTFSVPIGTKTKLYMRLKVTNPNP